jgi:hypothetical protein
MKATRKYNPEDRARAGRIAAQRMLELYGAHFVEGACSKGGVRGSHVRWHEQRMRKSKQCIYCIASEFPQLFEEN